MEYGEAVKIRGLFWQKVELWHTSKCLLQELGHEGCGERKDHQCRQIIQ